jgi:hypothetical protein
MLVRQLHVLCMVPEGMRRGNGQCAGGNRTSDEEENFMQGDSQPDAYANQQCDSCIINASVISFHCPHDFPFTKNITACANAALRELPFPAQILRKAPIPPRVQPECLGVLSFLEFR